MTSIIGRLATYSFHPGDPLPEVRSMVLVSGANCDVDSDQHRSYSWRQVIGYTDDDHFICLQTPGCWPTVERTTNCWFAEIEKPRPPGSSTAAGVIETSDEAQQGGNNDGL